MKPYETSVKQGDEEIKLVFDPSEMYMEQDEAIERVLVDAGYNELISEYFQSKEGQEIMTKVQDAKPSKKTDAAEATKIGMTMTTLFSKLHAALVKKNLRIELLSHLLVPQGMEYSEQSVRKVAELVKKRMKKDQAEAALASFFSSGRLWRDGFQTYFVGGTVSVPSPGKKTN